MRYNGASVDVLQDFTADRNRILSILETLVVGEGQGDAEPPPATTPATPARRSGRTTPSSTSSRRTGNWRRCRRRPSRCRG